MFRADEGKRREKVNECEAPDPWYGHTATDVTLRLHPPVPKHSGDPKRECTPDPCFNRTASDVTAASRLHPNNSGPDYYYGRQDTDVTHHLQVPVPKFANPYGCKCICLKKKSGKEELQTARDAHANEQRAFDYMHPLGAPRPYPLSDYYYHSGSKPSTPCGSRSGSPSRERRSPSPCRDKFRSRSPSPERKREKTSRSPRGSPRNRSRSPSPERSRRRNSRSPKGSPRDRSPDPEVSFECCCKQGRSRSRSPQGRRSRSRSRSPSYSYLPSGHNIPSRYLQCSNRCHLCPPCRDCSQLLEAVGLYLNFRESGGDCGAGTSHKAHRPACPFHGSFPCPLRANLPCYGVRPWSRRNFDKA